MYFHKRFFCVGHQRHCIVLFGVVSTVILLLSAWQKVLQLPVKNNVPASKRMPTTSQQAYPANVTSMTVNHFDGVELMKRAIKELETDEWKAPASLGEVVQKLRRMNSELLHTTTASFAQLKPPEPVLLEADRWKVNYVGCFLLNPTSKMLVPAGSKLQTQSVGDCVKICDQKNLTYAAISAGGWCHCGQSISDNSVLTVVGTADFCSLKCKYRPDIRSCGGYNFASVYKISMHTREILTLSDVHQISDGCFIKPREFETIFRKRAAIFNGSAANCLVLCEKAFEVIAAWDPQSEVCMCGKYDVRMPMESLQRIALTSHCDKKHCENTQNCKVRYVMLMRTYAQDNRCESRNFLRRGIGNLSALASFPGSGNTWLRHLIESASGIYSGSIYKDRKLYEQGFLGEVLPWNSKKTSVIKTHGRTKGVSFESAVVLIRNPYNALVAEYNRMAGGHVGVAKPEYFKINEWKFFIFVKVTKWLSVIEEFCTLNKVHVTYFEDVVTNPIGEVRAILEFLRLPIANLDGRLECLKSSMSGDFRRPKRKLDFDLFPNSIKEYINLFIKRGREILDKRGLPRLPDYERA